MDFEGNDYAGQRDRSEESLGGVREERCKENGEENAWRKSNDSLENVGSRESAGNRPCRGAHQKVVQQSGNYAETREHQRGGDRLGSFSDENTANFNDENVWEHGDREPRGDNFESGNGQAVFDANQDNNLQGNCESGINISVVSQRELVDGKKLATEPKYNVSFKSCYDGINQMWGKKRKKRVSCDYPGTVSFATKDDRKKRSKSKEKKGNIQKEECENPLNYRCTFESCCGNCESYVMEVPQNDCSAYQSCRSMEFQSANACFDECCCPREMKVYSSNPSVSSIAYPQQPCVTCAENEKCCPSVEAKCDYFVADCHASSKHCLQRVQFIKPDQFNDHSSCSFCSRKCTPSKASLFVEIGESVANVCNLRSQRSGQMFQSCDESMESLGDDAGQKGCSIVRRNKSDTLRSRSKSKKHGGTSRKCSPNCKYRTGGVGRSHSDRIACTEIYIDDDAIEQRTSEPTQPCGQRLKNVKSSGSFREKRECRSQTGSDLCVHKKTTDCDQQCETSERSLWENIRKERIWSQLQDTYRNLVKAAASSISQIVKQSSKLKRSKKCAEDCSAKQISIPNCGRIDLCTDQSNQSDCLGEVTCWEEIILDQPKNCETHCCQNACYSFNELSSLSGLAECQKYDYFTYCHNSREHSPSSTAWHFDSHDGDPPNRGLFKHLQRPKCVKARKRGGSDGNSSLPNQKSKLPQQSKRRSLPTAREQPGERSNRGHNNSNNQRHLAVLEGNNPRIQHNRTVKTYDGEGERTTTYVDTLVQVSTMHADVEPTCPPGGPESVAYHRIKALRRVETYSEAIPDGAAQELDASANQSSIPTTQRPPFVTSTPMPRARRPVSFDLDQTSLERDVSVGNEVGKTAAEVTVLGGTAPSSVNKEIQCEIIKDQRITCDRDSENVASEVKQSCVCPSDQTPNSLAGEAGTTITDTMMTAVDDTTESDAIAATAEYLPAETTVEGDTPQAAAEDITLEETAEDITLDETAEDITPDETAEDIVLDETAGNITLDETAEGTLGDIVIEGSAVVQVTADDTAEESNVAAIEETIIPVVEIDDSAAAVDQPEKTAAEATKETTLTPAAYKKAGVKQVDPSKGPIECSREFDGGRNYVSVDMQTSSTILTKILSEFQVGDKTRQILMSIKLQTTLNGGIATDEFQAASEDREASSTARQRPRQLSRQGPGQTPRPTPTRDIVPHSSQKQKKRSGVSKPTYPRTRRPKEWTGSRVCTNTGGVDGSIVGTSYQRRYSRDVTEDEPPQSRSGRTMRRYLHNYTEWDLD